MYLKDSLYDIWSQMESDKIDLEYSCDAVCSLARFYEKYSGEYQRRVKLNNELNEKRKGD